MKAAKLTGPTSFLVQDPSSAMTSPDSDLARGSQSDARRSTIVYKYGLATVTEVADAQRLLAQAEIDDRVARLNVWRSLLVAAKIQGDLKPFLRRVRP